MEQLYAFFLQLFPEGFDPCDMFTVYAFIGISILMIGGVGRIVAKGKGSAFSHALSSSVAVLIAYTVAGILYRLDPEVMTQIIDLLPMVALEDGNIVLFDFVKAGLPRSCTEILHLLILVFALILLDDLIPDAKSVLSWFILQFTITAFATILYCFFVHVVQHYAPEMLDSYAPLILISVLAGMMLLAVLKVILGLLLTAINPLFGAVYTFFFASKFGKVISKSVLSTLLLCIFVVFVQSLGYAGFTIIGGTLLPFLAFLMMLMVLWYLLGYVI